MTDREIFQKNFSELIRTSKVKQIDIARYAEVSYQTVSSWVCGRGYPRAEAMEKICKFFGIKQSVLTEEKKEADQDRLLKIYSSMSADGRRKLMERAEELLLLNPKRGRKNG